MINCKVCLVIIADTSICFLIPVSYFGANYFAYVNYTYAPSFFVVAMYFAVKYTTIINQSCFIFFGNFLFSFQTANAVPVTCAGHCLKGVGGGSGSGLSCTGSTHNIKQCILCK